ncbi:MAG: histidine phosphatase family protein [Candidatus Lokiarchaeota archaeon]|nr:histidine phosphatase family protein [Candidatus Lokiarchaeota archaeon]
MTNNILIFLRHAETKVEKGVKNSEWSLTTKGKLDALKIVESKPFDNINIIIASAEEKALNTAYPLAGELKIKILIEADLNEIKRDHGKFLDTQRYIITMKQCMTIRDKSFNNWETANNALERFSKKIEEIDFKHDRKKILIVSHGVVINLYFAKVLGKLEDVFDRAQTNTFCDYGIIQNNNVIRDIATKIRNH